MGGQGGSAGAFLRASLAPPSGDTISTGKIRVLKSVRHKNAHECVRGNERERKKKERKRKKEGEREM